MKKRKVYVMSDLDKEFIKSNYNNMSMNKMSAKLELPYSRVRNYMIDNNLTVSKERQKEFKKIPIGSRPKRKKAPQKLGYDGKLKIAQALGYVSVSYAIASLGLNEFNKAASKWEKTKG